MAVTEKQIITIKDPGCLYAFPVKSGQTIYQGTLCGIGKDGYLYSLSSSGILPEITCVGLVADDSANVTGTAATTANGSISGDREEGSAPAGDKTIRLVYLTGRVKLTFTSINQAMVGTTIYATDNYTVDDVTNGVNSVKIGTLVKYLSATSGYVDLNMFYLGDGVRVLRGAVTAAANTNGGAALSLANPTGKTCLIQDLIIDVTTGCTSAQTVDFGVAADGTTSSDTLLDACTTTAGEKSIVVNKGTNGGIRKWTSSQYITGTASAALTNLVATYAVFYRIWS